MAKEPKLYFDSEKEMFDCLDEWQARLGLSDWKIAARICGKEDMTDPKWAGESDVQFINSCGLISILRKEDVPADVLLKQPHEEILIHELLHFKFISFEGKSREEAVYDIMQHQLLQTIAHALYATKYDLPESWFIAEGHKFKENVV